MGSRDQATTIGAPIVNTDHRGWQRHCWRRLSQLSKPVDLLVPDNVGSFVDGHRADRIGVVLQCVLHIAIPTMLRLAEDIHCVVPLILSLLLCPAACDDQAASDRGRRSRLPRNREVERHHLPAALCA